MSTERSLRGDLAFIGQRIGGIEKTGSAQGLPYKFVEHHQVVAQASPLLHKAGIIVVPRVQSVTIHPTEPSTYNGNTKPGPVHAVVTLEVRFEQDCPAALEHEHPDADAVVAVVAGEGKDTGDKAVSKAITQGLKRAYMTVLGLAVNEGLDAAYQGR